MATRVLVVAWLLSGCSASVAVAQPHGRFELQVGAGLLSRRGPHGNAGRAPSLGLGGGMWLADRWGIAAWRVGTGGDGVAFSGRPRHPFAVSGRESYEFWTVTGRHRAFLNNGTELIVGAGAVVSGTRGERILERQVYRPGLLTETRHIALGPVDEAREEAWGGPTFALELLVARRVSGYVFFGGGLILLRDFKTVEAFQPVVFAGLRF